jgi:chemotaxis protein MotB
MNTTTLKSRLVYGSLFSALLLGGCVSQSDYDALKSQNQQLQTQVATQQSQIATQQAQISRLQGAIAYTASSDQLFASGSYQMSARGKRIIAQFASKLAPTQTSHILVKGYTDNAPIGPALQAQGITSNQILSQKRADAVRDFIISQGGKPDLIDAQGFGESDPIASNDTAAGRAKNRRVVLTLGSPSAG